MPRFETTITPDMIRDHGASGHWTGELIIDLADAAAAKTPDKPAIVDGGRTITFGDLRDASMRCAAALVSLGVGRSDVVSLQLPNRLEWTVLHLALSRIGAITNPLVPLFRDSELRQMLAIAGTRVLVVPDTFRGYDHTALAARLRAELPQIEHVIVIGETAPDGMVAWSELMATAHERDLPASRLEAMRPDPNDVTELIFTSGTTGEPKGVLHTNNTLFAPQRAQTKILNLTSQDVFHATSTFGHQTGFLSGVRLPLQLGATTVYQDVWDPAVFLQLVERHRITMTSGGPTFLQDMVRCPALGDHDVSSLRIFRCGGAPIQSALVREAREKLPGVAVHTAWGQSENGVVTMTRPNDPEDKIVGTDGRAQPGMEVRVVDADNRDLPAGTDGRLQCRGPYQFVGYANRPEMTRDSYVGDWFDTGDLARMDADGYIRITGRTKDIIIRGGENIPAAYVEGVLYEDKRVGDVAVVAMPDPRLGEKACAYVVCRSGASLTFADMQAFLEQRGVFKQYWPERLEIVEELPRAANGKILKAVLRDRIARALQGESAN